MTLTDSPAEHDRPRSSAVLSSEELTGMRQQICVKLGQCMVRLQQIEVGMKWLAGRSHFVSPAGQLVSELEKRQSRISGQTLGSVAELVGKQVLVPLDWERTTGELESAIPMVGSGITIGLSEDDREVTLNRLKELVERRNFLVHGFIEKFDIWTPEGCVAANEYLDSALAFIGAQLCEIREWVKDLSELDQEFARLLAEPEVQDLMFHGILPGGGGVLWPGSTIVQLLRAAEAELNEDGWTSLDAAIAFARVQARDHTPRRYGCVSWRQVLHDCGQFESRRGPAGQSLQGTTWYRSLDG